MRKNLTIILIFIFCGLAFGQNVEKKITTNYGSGTVTGTAINLPKPPKAWETCNCKFGSLIQKVLVQITIDENGNVVKANAVSGHPLFRAASEASARNSKFSQSFLSGKPQIMIGELDYTFDIEKSEISVSASPLKFEKTPIGNLNDKAVSLPMPRRPFGNYKVAEGSSVGVEIKIDLKTGNVVEAKGAYGFPLFKKYAEDAALLAKFDFTKSNLLAKFGTGILWYKVADFTGYNADLVIENSTKLPIINGQATFLPKPIYPQKAKDFCIGGKVKVEVLVDETGDVIEAKAISGDELLRESAVDAAKKAKFNQSDFNVKIKGIIVYNFDSLAPKCIFTNQVINNRAIYLPKPILSNVMGGKHLQLKQDEIVKVEIIVNEEGKVITARAISGHPLLRAVCENAARNTKFNPTNDVGRIRVKAFLIYTIKPNGEVETMIQ